MGKHHLETLIRELFFHWSADEAFNMNVTIIDSLEHNNKISHDLALYALKLAKAYHDLMEV